MIQAQIKKLRKDSGLGLTHFAKAVGVALQTIINWEQKGAKPNRIGLAKLNKYIAKQEKGSKPSKEVAVKKPKTIKKAKKKK